MFGIRTRWGEVMIKAYALVAIIVLFSIPFIIIAYIANLIFLICMFFPYYFVSWTKESDFPSNYFIAMEDALQSLSLDLCNRRWWSDNSFIK